MIFTYASGQKHVIHFINLCRGTCLEFPSGGRPSIFVDGRPFHRRLFYKVPILLWMTLVDELGVGLFRSTPSLCIYLVKLGFSKNKKLVNLENCHLWEITSHLSSFNSLCFRNQVLFNFPMLKGMF